MITFDDNSNDQDFRTPNPCGVFDVKNLVSEEYAGDSADYFKMNDLFGGDRNLERELNVKIVTGRKSSPKRKITYIQWGQDDQMPYTVINRVQENLVTSRCHAFNVMACYGQGLRFVDREKKTDVADPAIRHFCLRNSLGRVFGELVNDIKMFDMALVALVLSNDGNSIVQIRHLDICHCRLEKANDDGVVEHVLFGDFRTSHFDEEKIVGYELLNEYDPLGDLCRRLGKEPLYETGAVTDKPTDTRCFAMLCRMPSAGSFYYNVPAFWSIWKDRWVDIYNLIAIGKRHMIKNTSAPRMQIEVHDEYWDNLCDLEGIVDPEKRKARKKKEKEDIINFVTGVTNAGKALMSGYYVDPNGKENRMVRVNNINPEKQGGDWAEDGAEAANFICFAMGVHPNLVGATPGKSQMNNSGSDKRELFTLKQASEKPVQDVLTQPYHLMLHFNGLAEKATVDIPMTILTTLDQNKDKKSVSNTNNGNSDN